MKSATPAHWDDGLETAVGPIERSLGALVGTVVRHLRSAHYPRKPHRVHQLLDRAAGNLEALACQLAPHLVRPMMGVDERNHHFCRQSSLSLGKKRGSFAQNLVRALPLPVVALELLQPLLLLAGDSGAPALVALGLPHPAPQRLRRAADLRCDRTNRCPLRAMLGLVLEDQPKRPLPDFR